MGDPLTIWVPYFDDYEGGPTPPAFTTRELAEEYIAEKDHPEDWRVQEWKLFDRAPVPFTAFNHSGHLHSDGFLCCENRGVTQQHEEWADDLLRVLSFNSYGAWINAWGRTQAEADAEFASRLEVARRKYAEEPGGVMRCSTRCEHPAFAISQ